MLTLETAKAYVRAYYAKCDPPLDCDIEGCGIFTTRGLEVCRLNVTAGGSSEQWDVWSEPLMGGALYGEC